MSIIEQKEIMGNDLYKKVILKKNRLGIKTYQICLELDLEEELIANYFLGKCKDNLFLGVELLNYLEKKEDNL
jgi:hypothetical protein